MANLKLNRGQMASKIFRPASKSPLPCEKEMHIITTMLFGRLLFLFVVVPIVELFLLLQVGARIGFVPTLGLVVSTGVLGASLARRQGLSVLGKIQSEMKEGRPPALEMLEAAMVVIGGIVLLTPGILTDCLGFALMVPKFRRSLAHKVQVGFSKSFAGSGFASSQAFRSNSHESARKDDDVIDV